MVISVDVIRELKPYVGTHKDVPPTMRYTNDDTLTGVLGVKTKIFGTRRRFVRLERGMLYIHANGDDCGEPLYSIRMNEVAEIVANNQRATIIVRISSRSTMTLVFKHDVALLYLWLASLQRAKACRLENYYKTCGEIGEGHYAKVYVAFDKKTGDKFAVKVMPKEHRDPKIKQYAKREAEIVRLVNHPNVVSTYDVFETSDAYQIVMEYIDGGNLVNFLASGKNRVNEKNGLRIAKQLLQAISYLHGKDIIHRDIKAENILVTTNGTVKVADFGLARRLDGVGSDEYCLSSILGTPAYCSPEVVTRSTYGKPVDIFGCGVLLYIALSGSLPFSGNTPEEVFAKIAKGKVTFPKRRWELVSVEARSFVSLLMSHRPSDRPTASQALGHPWLQTSLDRESGTRPISPKPFVRNTSARTNVGRAMPSRKPLSAQFPRATSSSSFRRAQSGSLRQLTLEKMKQRLGQMC